MKATMNYLSSMKSRCFMFIACFSLLVGITSCSDDFEGYGPDKPQKMTDAELVEQQLKMFYRLQTRAGVDSLFCMFITTKSNLEIFPTFTGSFTIDWGDNSPIDSVTNLSVSSVTVSLTHTYTDGQSVHTVAIYGEPAMTRLSVYDNEILHIDITKCTDLWEFSAHWNRLQSIDITNNVKLLELHIGHNPNLSGINLSGNDSIESLNIGSTGISSVNVSNLTNLKYLCCEDTPMSHLNVTSNRKLQRLESSWTNLSSINLSNNPDIYSLHLANNNISVLNISHLSSLEALNISNNYLNCNLNLSFTNYINYLNVENCGLTDLILSNGLLSLNLYSMHFYNFKDNPFVLDMNKMTDICAKLPDRTGATLSSNVAIGPNNPHFFIISYILGYKNYTVR